MKLHESFLGGGYLTGTSSVTIFGCTNPNSSNYNPNATNDDNSCIACVYGCTNAASTNYDANATCDDGTCIIPVYGCMDANAFNYNPNANVNQVSEQNAADPCVPIVYGCVDVNSFNYDPNANTDDGSCTPIIYGCTNPLASNYNSNANTDDGSCSLPYYNCSVGASNLTFNETIVQPGSTSSSVYVTIGATYNVTPVNSAYLQNNNTPVQYQDFTFSNFLVQYKLCGTSLLTNVNVSSSSVNIVENLDLTVSSCYEFIITASCDYTGNAGFSSPATPHVYSLQVNTPALIPVLGCTDPFAVNYDVNANTDDGSCDYSGCTDPNANNYNSQATIDDGSCTYDPIYGCMLNTYINYNSTATVACDSSDPNQASENWNCATPGPNCCCGDLIYYGCTDPAAVNQDLSANTLCTDSSDPLQNNNGQPCTECIYPFQVGCTDSTAGDNPDINGYCNDGDGWPTYNNSTFVGVGVLGGCTLNSPSIAGYNVSNYNPEAVQDTSPSSCITPVFGCTDDSSCSYDVNATANPFNACTSPSFFCPPVTNLTATLGNNPFEEIIINFSATCNVVPGLNSQGVGVNISEVGGAQDVVVFSPVDNFQSGQTVSGLTQNTTYEVVVFNMCAYGPNYSIGIGAPVITQITTQQVLTPGCMDNNANNFDPLANTPCTSCTGNNQPNCCCTYDVLGCTDPNASNYNSSATVDDGSCLYDGCMDPSALNYDPNATNDVGCAYCPDIQAITGQTVIDGNVPAGTQATNPITGRLSQWGAYASNGGTAAGWKASLGNIYVAGASYGNFTATEDPSWQALAPGIHRISAIYSTTPIADPSAETFANYGNNQINSGWVDPGNIQFKTSHFSSNGNFSVGGMPGGTTMYLYLMTHCDPNELPNSNTTSIPPSSTVSMTPIEFQTVGILGCTNSQAINYNPNASVDDGSCTITGDSCSDPISFFSISGWTEYTGLNNTTEVGYYPTFTWYTPGAFTNTNPTVPPIEYALLLDEINLLDSFTKQGRLALTDLSQNIKQSAFNALSSESTSIQINHTEQSSTLNLFNAVGPGTVVDYNTLVGFVVDNQVSVNDTDFADTDHYYGGFFTAKPGDGTLGNFGNSASMVNRFGISDANGTNTFSSFYHANNAWKVSPTGNLQGNPNFAQNISSFHPQSTAGGIGSNIEYNATTIVRAKIVPRCGTSGYEFVNSNNQTVYNEMFYNTPAPCRNNFGVSLTMAEGWKSGNSRYPYPHPVKVLGVADNDTYDPNNPNDNQVGVIVRFQINNGCEWGSYEVPKMQLNRREDTVRIDYGPMIGKISFDPYNNGGGNHVLVGTNSGVSSSTNFSHRWNFDAGPYSVHATKSFVNPNNMFQFTGIVNGQNTFLFQNHINSRRIQLGTERCSAYFNLVIPLTYLGGLSHFNVSSKAEFLNTYSANIQGLKDRIMALDTTNNTIGNAQTFYGIRFNRGESEGDGPGIKKYCWGGGANTYDSFANADPLNESGTVHKHNHNTSSGFRLKWGNLDNNSWMA